jgi:hypothetical protein
MRANQARGGTPLLKKGLGKAVARRTADRIDEIDR